MIKWDKPEKVISTEEWKAISADSAPPGVYTPNMSKEDEETWRGKVVGIKVPPLRVELRKTLGGAQVVLVVSRVGLPDFNGITPENIRLSMNGPLYLTFAEFEELKLVVDEALARIDELT